MTPSAATLETLASLLGFATVSRESNLGLIEFVRDRLAALGVRARLTYDASGGKANLFATLGERAGAGLVLSGHTDVVPVDGQDWTTDPFAATIRDGRVYGRGSADMKGFLAVALGLAETFLAADHAEPIHLALSYDEEVGCLGVHGLLADLDAAGIRPRGCIVGEPTGMGLVIGHKGAAVYGCEVKGRAAHSSLAPHGVNAIEIAALLIARLLEIGARLQREERRHAGFDVPYTTINTGRIDGGIATNIVAAACNFRFDVRHLPWTDPASLVAELERYAVHELLPRMRATAPESDITFRALGAVPAFDVQESDPLVAYVAARQAQHGGCSHVGFGTEAGLFQRAGIQAVICGPGSIEQAHKPDEFVELAQLAACEQLLRSLVAQ